MQGELGSGHRGTERTGRQGGKVEARGREEKGVRKRRGHCSREWEEQGDKGQVVRASMHPGVAEQRGAGLHRDMRESQIPSFITGHSRAWPKCWGAVPTSAAAATSAE